MLLVSREPSALQPLLSLGRENSWRLETANNGWDALQRVQSEAGPDLLILDLARGDGENLHTLRWVKGVRPDIPVILLSHAEDVDHRLEALRLGAQDYLVRPVNKEKLEKTIRRCLETRRRHDDLRLSNLQDVEEIDDGFFFVAGSPAARKLRTQVELLAQVNVPVLILGENGSGKEIVARLIHKRSIRSGFKFLKVNCATVPAELLENELFGRERGALAGDKPGESGFARGEKSTILLDDIAEMPAIFQEKLLNILQDDQLFRVHSQAAANAGVRILAAAETNAAGTLGQKRFREDLYYRLSTFSIYVPPLRERAEEIPLLMGHFMRQMSEHYSLPPRPFSPAVLRDCQSYTWPGNLRELENFVKRYLIIDDEELALSELGRSNGSGNHTFELPPSGQYRGEGENTLHGLKSLVKSVKGEAEKHAIAAALDQTHWNRKAAARLLRVSYRTLLYKIDQYHINPPS